MDKNCNLKITHEIDIRSPLKELDMNNIKLVEICDTQNKSVQLSDVESSFLQNSVSVPAELNLDQNIEFVETANSNQENLIRRTSNNFNSIIKKEADEVTFLNRNNDNITNLDPENYSDGENFLDITDDSTDINIKFVNVIVEDFVKKAVEISAAVNFSVYPRTSEGLNNSSNVSDNSTNSDTCVLDTTVILKKPFINENDNPEKKIVDSNCNAATIKSSNLSVTNSGESEIVKKHLNLDINSTEQILIDSKRNEALRLSQEENINTADQTSVGDSSKELFNAPYDLSSSHSWDRKINKEEKVNIVSDTETISNSPIVNDSFIDALFEKVVLSPKKGESDISEIKDITTEEQIPSQYNESVNNLELSSDYTEVTHEFCTENISNSSIVNQSFINAFSKKLVLSQKKGESDISEIKDITTEEQIASQYNESVDNLKLSSDYTEISHEISTESLEIANNLIDKQEGNTSNSQLTDLNTTTTLSEGKRIIEIHEAPEFGTNCSKNVSFEINNRNSEANEILNETRKENKNDRFENENALFVVTNSSSQIIEVLSEINKESINCYPTQSPNSTENNKSISNKAENLITFNKSVAEETHMSDSETNAELNETTSATCTNEMGEIINQNECFEKESNISIGAIDNKESLEAKARVYKEMEEKYIVVETECEKYKALAADLKQELKSCRLKTMSLETEVADFKVKTNELNLLVEEFKQSATNKSDTKEQNEQLQRLRISEEALKNEVKELKALMKQNDTHLKELQRKEVKLSDDLSSKTQSEIQISRIIEEYEKSISNFITENEKLKKERDSAQMHLANIEMAFSDVHKKYEGCKAMVQGYKDNEESFKQDITMNRETIVIQEQKYETLKAHAMAQLEKSNQELAVMKKQHETEMARLTAQLKRYEIKNVSLMESLQQKAKECEQLSAVCDEFIGNV